MKKPAGAKQLVGDTYYVPGLTNSGYIDGLTVDTGPEPEVYEGASVDTLLITHGHTDHFAAGELLRRNGASVLAGRDDAHLIENPENNIRGMFSWAKPTDELVTKLFKGLPCDVDGLLEGWTDDRARVFHTPGHTVGHHVVLTSDGVLFTGDALYQEQIWNKHRLPYCIDPGLVISSLELILGLDFEWMVPGHGEPSDRDTAERHVAFHLKRIEGIETFIVDTLATERTTEDVIAIVSSVLGLPSNPATYWLAVTTVKGFLGGLLAREEIEFFVRDNAGWWKRAG